MALRHFSRGIMSAMPTALANLTGLIAFARVADLRSFAEAAR